MWILLLSCRSIPDAPMELDQLGSYLFENFEREDSAYMELGVENLRHWIQGNRESINEGYRIDNITEQAVVELEISSSVDLENLIGAAVGTDVAHPLSNVITVVLESDPMEISPDAYGYFDTQWTGDVDCFLSKDCSLLEYESSLQNLFPLGIEMSSKVQGQYLWVSNPEGDFVIQRRWMLEGESNQDWLNVEQDYGLAVYMPTEQGTLCIDVEWVVTYLGDSPFPEDFALGMAIDSMQAGRKTLEEYISANP